MASPPSSPGDEALAHRLRRSHLSSSPPIPHDFDVHWENRHSEVYHNECLAESYNRHNEVRASALRALERHVAEQQLKALQRQNEEAAARVRLAQMEAEQLARAKELEKKQRAIPPPAPDVPPQPKTPTSKPAPQVSAQAAQVLAKPSAVSLSTQQQTPQPAPAVEKGSEQSQPAAIPTPQAAKPQPQLQPAVKPAEPVSAPVTAGAPIPKNSSSSEIHPDAARFLEIHKACKALRHTINEACNRDPAFRKKSGEMRRTIRQSLGQLTANQQANRDQTKRVAAVLQEALENVQSPLINPGDFLVKPDPDTKKDALNNGPQMPMLFIFLLNMFAKAIIAQLIDESGVRPETAGPIGILAVSIFSKANFLWRGVSFIDILMAKFRVVCPVIFGFRGNEKTEEGRTRVGWWKYEGQWIQEQVHNVRMTGLGAGYSAICLRDFSLVSAEHPYAPWHYWQTMAWIVDTPRDQVCDTQYLVLKAMIQNFEAAFMKFYGSTARAALQVALVHFPASAPTQTAAVKSLAVLADKLKMTTGWDVKTGAFTS